MAERPHPRPQPSGPTSGRNKGPTVRKPGPNLLTSRTRRGNSFAAVVGKLRPMPGRERQQKFSTVRGWEHGRAESRRNRWRHTGPASGQAWQVEGQASVRPLAGATAWHTPSGLGTPRRSPDGRPVAAGLSRTGSIGDRRHGLNGRQPTAWAAFCGPNGRAQAPRQHPSGAITARLPGEPTTLGRRSADFSYSHQADLATVSALLYTERRSSPLPSVASAASTPPVCLEGGHVPGPTTPCRGRWHPVRFSRSCVSPCGRFRPPSSPS